LALARGAGGGTPRQRLADARTWLYYLNDDFVDRQLQRTLASSYDVVVIDPAVTIKGRSSVPIASAVGRLRRTGKLVLAYVDVGEAESYRSYWRAGWRIGHPWWILAGDPDGWRGNYPVAYWAHGWQRLWLARGGLFSRVLAAGFDGIYLDWTEAYSDDRVARAARRMRRDPRAEMIRWIARLAQYGRSQHPGFVVVNQNAAELVASEPRVRTLLDGEAQEQVFFDGGADNRPPGDCPLPERDSDIGTRAYLNRLTPACRRVYTEHPDSTLHVSSESYLRELRRIHRAGLPVFTIDYATAPANVRHAYCRSRAEGFVPFASQRSLSTFVDPASTGRARGDCTT
jgi:cysteinyl-tRNA synthetase